jgi:hypothetical protein
MIADYMGLILFFWIASASTLMLMIGAGSTSRATEQRPLPAE